MEASKEDKENEESEDVSDTALDADYVSQLFRNLDWNQNKKNRSEENGRSWMSSKTMESTYAYKYLMLKLEPEQIDLNNPFDVEPSNPLRRRLIKKRKKENKELQLDLVTEGVREIKDTNEEEEKDEDDYVDEYGNIRPEGFKPEKKENKEPKVNNQKPTPAPKTSPNSKQEKKKNLRERKNARAVNENARQARMGWQDLDSDQPDIRKIDIMEKAKVFSKPEFPRLSSLSYFDQENFLKLQAKYLKGELQGKQEKIFLNLSELVQEERHEFNMFAMEHSKENISRYNFILPGLEKYASDRRNFRLPRFKSHPRYWSKVKEVRLCPVREEQKEMDHFMFHPADVEPLLELGTIPKANVPKPKNLNQVSSSYNRIVNKFPADPSIVPGSQGMSRSDSRRMKMTENPSATLNQGTKYEENKYLHNTCIIQDPNAMKLAAQYVPDVIISASALKCLIDNFFPKLDRSWEIPVHVQTFDQVVAGKLADRKIVVFVGKPLPARQVTAIDKNRLAMKYALRTILLCDWNEGKPDKHSSSRGPTVSANEDDLFGDVFDISSLETFGNENLTDSGRQDLSKAADKSDADTDEKQDKSKLETDEKQDKSKADTVEKQARSKVDTVEKQARSKVEAEDKLLSVFDPAEMGDDMIQTDGLLPDLDEDDDDDDDIDGYDRESDFSEVGEYVETVINMPQWKDFFQVDGGLSSDSEDGLMIDEDKKKTSGEESTPTRNTRSRVQKVTEPSQLSVEGTVRRTRQTSTSSSQSSTSGRKKTRGETEKKSPKKASPVKGTVRPEPAKDSGSSSESEISGSEDLLNKKLDISSNDLGNSDKNAVLDSSSSEEELDASVLSKKLSLAEGTKSSNEKLEQKSAILKSEVKSFNLRKEEKLASEISYSSMSSSDSEEDGDNLVGKKMYNFSQTDLFGSPVEDSDDNLDDPDEISPKKKVKALSSSESEEEPGDSVLKKKLEELGRGAAPVSRVKKKIETENRLKLLATRQGDKNFMQKKDRGRRAEKRKEGSESQETMATDGTKETQEIPKSEETSSQPSQTKSVIDNNQATKLNKRCVVSLKRCDEVLQSSPAISQKSASPSQPARKSANKDAFVPKVEGICAQPPPTAKQTASFDDLLGKALTSQTKRKAETSDKGNKKKEQKKNDPVMNQLEEELAKIHGVEDRSNLGILDSLLTGQSRLLGKEKEQKNAQVKKTYHGEELKSVSGLVRDPGTFLPPPPGTNLNYRLWNLWAKEKPNSNIRMIVRSKVAGFSPEFGAVVPSVKLEYQASLGGEVCSVSTYSREWMDNILRPGSTTIRARVNPLTADVCMIQPLSLKQLTVEGRQDVPCADGRMERFDPAVQLGNIHSIASELRQLPAGRYLLAHDSKTGPFCRLYKDAEEGKKDLDLETIYAGLKGEDTVPVTTDPWVPLDINLNTPWHIRTNRVPGTFEPHGKPPKQKNNRGGGRFRGGQGGRGGRGGRGGGGHGKQSAKAEV